MKLRIRSNTIRFRLGQQDISSLADEGYAEEVVRFGAAPDQEFFYRVEVSPDVEQIGLQYQPGRITVILPDSLCRELQLADAIGFEEVIPVGEGRVVSVLIEKDYACLKARNPAEDEGAYPHPQAKM